MMSELVSVERIIELIKSLSLSDRELLFSKLQIQGMGTPGEGEGPYPTTEPLEIGNATCDISEIVSIKLTSTQSNHSLLQVPTTLKNNPLFDEVLSYIEADRRQLDAELETSEELEVGTKTR